VLEFFLFLFVRAHSFSLHFGFCRGPNRYAANAAFTALVAAEFGFEVDYFRSYAASQINYMLGMRLSMSLKAYTRTSAASLCPVPVSLDVFPTWACLRVVDHDPLASGRLERLVFSHPFEVNRGCRPPTDLSKGCLLAFVFRL